MEGDSSLPKSHDQLLDLQVLTVTMAEGKFQELLQL